MHVMFVCLGNICRSPMAERVARKLADDRGLELEFTSTGTSAEESGNPMDHRARRLLSSRGYDGDGHRARRADRELVREADLVVVAEDYHADRIEALGVDRDRIRLITDYDPEAEPGSPLPDPWYGDEDDFVETLEVLERAIPEMLDEIGGKRED